MMEAYFPPIIVCELVLGYEPEVIKRRFVLCFHSIVKLVTIYSLSYSVFKQKYNFLKALNGWGKPNFSFIIEN